MKNDLTNKMLILKITIKYFILIITTYIFNTFSIEIVLLLLHF